MKVLICGKDGQLGRDLIVTVPDHVEIIAYGHQEMNICYAGRVDELISSIKPDIIINAAAYTAVDQAEDDPVSAFAVNAEGVANLARSAHANGCMLLHISTDYVFDGCNSVPYRPSDPINPINEYGRSKAEGERRIRAIHAHGSIILRTSWVYSVHGKNFVKSMLKLINDRKEISAVSDQIGSPTWSRNLAGVIWSLIDIKANPGIYHWSDSSMVSRYDFACAVYKEALAIGLVENEALIVSISSNQYPTRAERPKYSVLDTSETARIIENHGEHWLLALRKMLIELKELSCA